MDLTGSVQKFFRVAGVTGGLLVLACLQAGPANCGSNQLFTEKWQQKQQCKNPGGGQECRDFASGNFTIKTTFPGTCLVPSDLQPGSGNEIFIGLGEADGSGSGSGSGSGTFTGGFFFDDPDVGDDFAIKVFSNKTVATGNLTRRVCNPPNTNCKFVNFGKVKLTVNSSGDFTVQVNANTGFNFNGDHFADSIDAANFVGQNGPVSSTDEVFFDVEMEPCFDLDAGGSIPVAVSGKAKTSKSTSTKPALSTVNIKGTL